MRSFASAVILCFLMSAPAFAHQEQQPQDERAKHQEAKPKPQEAKPKQQEEKAKPQEQPSRHEEQSHAKTEEKQQRTTQKQNETQQKNMAKQQKEQAKQERSGQEAKARQDQDRAYAKQQQDQQKEIQKQQRSHAEHAQPAEQHHGVATRQEYHAADIHPHHGGRAIADRDYDDHFGRDHDFHVSWHRGDRRFQYGGYWFEFGQTWPADWSYGDQFYIVYDYDSDDYYLCDVDHPGIQLLVVVQS
jgi:hypothetical protein